METLTRPKKIINKMPPKPRPFRRFIAGNFLNLLLTAALLVVAWFLLFRKVEKPPAGPVENVAIEKESSDTETEKSRIISQRKNFVPKRSSSRAEKMNTTDDEKATPEFVAEQTKTLIRVLDGQILGAERTLDYEKDPKKIAEIKRRLEGAKRFRAKLEAVNPNDESTWFFLKDKEKGNSKELEY